MAVEDGERRIHFCCKPAGGQCVIAGQQARSTAACTLLGDIGGNAVELQSDNRRTAGTS